MRKKLFFLLLAVLYLPIVAWADTWTDSESNVTYEYDPDGAEATVTSYSGWLSELTIPDVITVGWKNYDVTAIADEVFADRAFTSITLPKSLRSIGKKAFYDCYLLRSIVLPENLTSIGESAFEQTSGLLYIVSESYNPIAIPSNILGDNSYYYDRVRLYVPYGSKELYVATEGWSMFQHIKEGVNYVNWMDPNSNVIYEYDVYGTEASVVSARSYYYSSKLEIPDVVTIDNKDYSVTNIGDGAFTDCSLSGISLPHSLKTIGANAFYGNNFTEIELPENLTSIGEGAFSGCSYLVTVRPKATTPLGISTKIFDLYYYGAITLYVPKGSKNSYEGKSGWNKFLIKEEGVDYFTWTDPESNLSYEYSPEGTTATVISSTNLLTREINIPRTIEVDGVQYVVTDIGKAAFKDQDIQKVVLPESLRRIGNQAFQETHLTEVKLPKNIIYIGGSAFSNCDELKTVVSESKTPYEILPHQTFNDCWNVTLLVPEGTQNSYRATAGWNEFGTIEEIIVPKWTDPATNLTYEYDPESGTATVIESPNLVDTEITIPGTITVDDGKQYLVTAIGDNAFSSKSIKKVVFPESLKSIGQSAFREHGMSTIILPENLESIGEKAFVSTTYFTESQKVISLSKNPCAIPTGAFNEEITLYVPSGTKELYQSTAGWSSYDPIKDGTYDRWTDPETNITYEYDIDGDEASVECSNVSGSVVIPSTIGIGGKSYRVTAIGNRAFYTCEIADIELPEGLEKIGRQVFYQSSISQYILRKIVFPASLRSIGNKAFMLCDYLVEVHSLSKTPYAIPDDMFYSYGNYNRTLYVPYGTKDAYLATSGWNTFSTVKEGFPSDWTDPATNITYRYYEGTTDAVVIGCSDLKQTDIFIPATICVNGADYAVTSIEDGVFKSCGLTSVILSENIVSIGKEAFYKNNLTSVILPESLASIGENAFSYNNLTSVVLPENLASIGETAFYGNNLTSIVLPESLTSIGSVAFGYNPNLSRVTSLSKTPCQYNSLFDTYPILYVPEATEDIYASMGWYSFIGVNGCAWWTREWTDPETNLSFGYDLQKAEACVIYSKGLLKSNITIPATIVIEDVECRVKAVENYAFYSNSALANIILPETLEKIGLGAFNYCSVSSITSLSKTPYEISTMLFDVYYESKSNVPLYVPEGTVDAYRATKGWDMFNDIRVMRSIWTDPETSVIYAYYPHEDEACVLGYDDPSVASVAIRDIIIGKDPMGEEKEFCVVSIEKNAFKNNPTLTAVTLSDNLLSIGDYAFASTGLTEVELPSTLTSIGSNAFSDCSNLSGINIPEGVTTIGYYAFSGTALTEITIPGSVTELNYCFYGCSPLQRVTISEGVEKIGWSVFGGCQSLTFVSIPSTVTSISNYTFSGCNSLKNIVCYVEDPLNINDNVFPSSIYDSAKLRVPEQSVEAYKNTSYAWKNFKDIEGIGGAVTLAGVVVAKDDENAPIQNATITLTCNDIVYSATTDTNGHYEIEVADNTLIYEVMCQAEGFIDSPSIAVDLIDGDCTQDFSLLAGATIVMTDAGVCTYSSPVALDMASVTDMVKGYYAKTYSNDQVKLTEVPSTVAAGEGMILVGTSGMRIDIPAATSADVIEGNLLHGTAFAPYSVESDDVYVLSNKTGNIKFHKAAVGLSIPKQKAYLQLNVYANALRLIWDEETPTNIVEERMNSHEGTVYDLLGRPVANDKICNHRIRIIKGKKYMVK